MPVKKREHLRHFRAIAAAYNDVDEAMAAWEASRSPKLWKAVEGTVLWYNEAIEGLNTWLKGVRAEAQEYYNSLSNSCKNGDAG